MVKSGRAGVQSLFQLIPKVFSRGSGQDKFSQSKLVKWYLHGACFVHMDMVMSEQILVAFSAFLHTIHFRLFCGLTDVAIEGRLEV